MRKRRFGLLAITMALLGTYGYGQQVGINEDGSLPHPNAILDVKSFKKGILIPRMSTTDRLSISNTNGLLVYDTTTLSFWYNNGKGWQNMTGAPSTGNSWLLSGNAATNDSNFIGTTDYRPFRLRVNNMTAGRIAPAEGNTFYGYNTGAASQNTYSWYNTGIGGFSLYRNTTGSYNTATGSHALYANTTGNHNTANGMEALIANTTGNHNTAVGSRSLNVNLTGYSNIAVGSFALGSNNTGYENTAVGMQALTTNTTGSKNTAIGAYSLMDNITGTKNTATGFYALNANTAEANSAHGAYALMDNTTGGNNSAAGMSALMNNTVGSQNTADGAYALHANTTGNFNTAVGAHAIKSNVGGGYNTAMGYYALQALAVGDKNTCIGSFANVLHGTSTVNSTAIGYDAVSYASNRVRLGNSAVTSVEGPVPFSTPSDGRFKYDIKEDVKGLDFILQLRPVTYNFDTKKFDAQKFGFQKDAITAPVDDIMQAAYNDASAIRRSGFIAQEVDRAAADAGYNFSGVIKPKNEQEHYALSYESFVVPMVKAIQELNGKMEELKKENESLKKEIKQLQQSK